MRIVHLWEPIAPSGTGFYEVGPAGVGHGPFTGEGARARYALMLAAGVAVWRHDPLGLHEAEDEDHLIQLLDRAEAEVGFPRMQRAADETEVDFAKRLSRARAALAATIRRATLGPPIDRLSGPRP